MSNWHIHLLHRRLGEHAPAWDALRARLFRANPMLDSRLVDSALSHFGEGQEHLCVLEDGGQIQAMCVLRPAGAGRWASFLPSQMQIGPTLLGDPQQVPALMRKLPGLVLRIDFLCNDPEFGDLSGGEYRAREVRDHALTMSIRLDQGFSAYWSTRPKKLVQNIGRYQRRLADKGLEARMVRVDAPEALADAVARYARLESAGWKGARGTALAFGDVQGQFYLEVMHRFSDSGGAKVYELWLGDTLAASRLIVAHAGCIVMLKTAYDESLAAYSPGRLLLHRVIEDLHAVHPQGVIEFYTDANVDLLAWSTGSRWIRHATFDLGSSVSLGFDLMRASRQIRKAQNAQNAVTVASCEPDRVEAYRHPDEFPAAVQRLFESAEAESFEFGLTWYSNLIEAVYRDNASVLFVTVWVAGLPMASLPICIDRNRWGTQVLSLANYYSALFAPILAPQAKPDHLALALQSIRDGYATVTAFRMGPMDPDSRAYRCLLSALRSVGMVPFPFFCFGNWYMQVNDSWETYLANRDGALRNTIKRMARKFAADGGRMEVVVDDAGLEEGLVAYEQVYAKSWKVQEPFPRFMPGLVRACAKRGWLRMGIAWLNGQPVASQVWIVTNGKASIYKLAHDEAFKTYAPGTLLTAMLLQHVIDKDKVSEVDYLIGDDPYKRVWLSDRRERWGLVAYNVRGASGAMRLAWEVLGRAVRKLRPQRSIAGR